MYFSSRRESLVAYTSNDCAYLSFGKNLSIPLKFWFVCKCEYLCDDTSRSELKHIKGQPNEFFSVHRFSGSGSDLGSTFNSSSPVHCTAQRGVSILNVMSQ